MSESPVTLDRQRVAEARRMGYSPRSAELTAGTVLLVAAWVVPYCVPNLLRALQDLMSSSFQFELSTVRDGGSLGFPVQTVMIEVGRLLGACLIAALVADLGQVGIVWHPVTVIPHPRRLLTISQWATAAPLERAAGLIWRVSLGLAGLLGLAWIHWGNVASLDDPQAWLEQSVKLLSRGMGTIGGFCLFCGILDAGGRRKRWTESLRMSDDELRRQ